MLGVLCSHRGFTTLYTTAKFIEIRYVQLKRDLRKERRTSILDYSCGLDESNGEESCNRNQGCV